MSDEIEFVSGLFFKLPHENAPDFVKGSLSMKPKELIDWLQKRTGEEFVNVSLKVAKSGKGYASVDTWKPKDKSDAPKPAPASRGSGGSLDSDDIPFAPKITRRNWAAL